MSIEVYDFNNPVDHTHVLVTPQIRAQLLRIKDPLFGALRCSGIPGSGEGGVVREACGSRLQGRDQRGAGHQLN